MSGGLRVSPGADTHPVMCGFCGEISSERDDRHFFVGLCSVACDECIAWLCDESARRLANRPAASDRDAAPKENSHG